MEKSWTTVHGTPRVGPVKMDFVYPYPYPPVYMVVNGALLRLFSYDIGVSRALGAVTGLAAAAILFWIGCRLRDKAFGFLCAASFLVYSEAVINYRWVRGHPFGGTLALAAVGFLIRYVQEKRLRDAVWAGIFCSLATGSHYFNYPLIGAVTLTVVVVNWRDWRTPWAWGHVFTAVATACAFAGSLVVTYSGLYSWGQLMDHVRLLTSVTGSEVRSTFSGEVNRFLHNVWTFCLETPTQGPPQPWSGTDWWLRIAAVGFICLPVTKNKWLRLWVPIWLLFLMYGVFKKLNNVSMFFYPATTFLAMMAVGFAGVLTWIGEGARRIGAPSWRVIPGVAVCSVFGLLTLPGALTHFNTKIDLWTQRSSTDAEAVMQYVNDRTTTNDMVVAPKQIYWLVKTPKKSMLTYCARYKGVDNDMPVPTHIPEELYWFDPRLENARFVVMEYGAETIALPDGRRGQLPMGIDAVYTVPVLRGVKGIIQQMQKENWPVVKQQGA
ncbi:MAG: glycosyltransferase family 39 protein, partial [bacterium]